MEGGGGGLVKNKKYNIFNRQVVEADTLSCRMKKWHGTIVAFGVCEVVSVFVVRIDSH